MSVGAATAIIVHGRTASHAPPQIGAVLLWQAAIYGSWLPVALAAGAIARRLWLTPPALAATLALGATAVPLHAALAAALDARFARVPAPGLLAAMVARLPVDMLVFTALACAAALLSLRRRQGELAHALEAARSRADACRLQEPARFLVSVGTARVPVAIELIESLTAAGNYVVVAWLDRQGLVRGTLAALTAQLDPAVFVRAHRSTVVNLTKVERARPLADGSWRLTMRSGSELIVSRSHRATILDRLGHRERRAGE